MLTIGDVAHRTGVSRRMLRYWEAEGLLTPAAIDPVTGYRRFTPAQAGRVHAIAALRTLGFSLAAIADLLDPGLTTARLLDVLRSREHELAERIAIDTDILGEVRRRLRSIEEGLLMTAQTLQLQTLPALTLAGLSSQVSDETEIGHAVGELDAELRARLADDGRTWPVVVRTYAPAPGDGPIEVRVAVEIPDGVPPAGLEISDLPQEPQGASITYDGAVESEADAWLALDAALEPYRLATAGAYRVLVTPSSVTLQARTIPRPCD